MIRNAVGTVISSTMVTATTNRTIGRFFESRSSTGPPRMTIASTSATIVTRSSGTAVKMIFPGSVSRFQDLPTTVTWSCLAPNRSPCSFVDAAHDRVQAGHDRHRVRDEVAGHHDADRLQVDERRVVDPHPEGLVAAITDDVCRVLPARAFDRGVGAARPRPEETRHLREDWPVRHVVKALVDDPKALLDLVHPEEVSGQAVALRPGRDIELELWKDAVWVSPPDIERDPRRPQVRAGHHHPQRRRRVDRAEPTHPADEDLVLVEERVGGFDLLGRLGHPAPEAAHEVVIQVAVAPADPEVVEEHPLARQRREHLDDVVALDE